VYRHAHVALNGILFLFSPFLQISRRCTDVRIGGRLLTGMGAGGMVKACNMGAAERARELR
jgi:hypothetical protein